MTLVKTTLKRQWPLIIVFVACLFLGPIQFMLASAYESRVYRDTIRSTPFYNVHVLDKVEVGTSIMIAGDAIKRRCIWYKVAGLIYDVNGYAHYTPVDMTEAEKVRPIGNQPVSTTPQYWGPWKLTPPLGVVPYSYEIWQSHFCPESPRPVDNLFVSGPWHGTIVDANPTIRPYDLGRRGIAVE